METCLLASESADVSGASEQKHEVVLKVLEDTEDPGPRAFGAGGEV